MILDTLKKYLPARQRPSPAGWISIDCPACQHLGHRPDTRSRGGVLFTEGFSYHCFNCGFTTRWQPGSYFTGKNVDLFHYLNVPDAEINACRLSVLDQDSTPLQGAKIRSVVHSLPEDARSFTDLINENHDNASFVKVLEYLLNRNPKFIEWHEFYWSPQHKQRLIIPVTYSGKIVGWSGRSIERKPKVKYLAQVNKGFVFNGDNLQKDRKYALICEGELDAISIDGCAIMSDSVTAKQREYFDASDQIKVVVPDRDRSGKVLVEQALDFNWYVAYPEWPEKDCAEAVAKYGRLACLVHLMDRIVTSPLKIKILSKDYFR